MIELRAASLNDGVDVWSMLHEIGPGENGYGNDGATIPLSRFGTYLQSRIDMHHGHGLKEGYVPFSTYWLFRNDHPVGVSKLRHNLTDSLRRHGGHIGYCVRPTSRGRGYGTAILRLTLEQARLRGISEVLVTINQDNSASCRVAEANGGVIDRIDNDICYYWLETAGVVPGAQEVR